MCRKSISVVCLAVVLGVAGTVSADLVAHWRLDDGAGAVAADSSGNGNDAAVVGAANWTAGKNGGALDFDGTSTYIEVDNEIVRGTWSLTMWLKPRDIPYTSGYYAVLHTDGWSGGGTHLHLRANTSLLNCDFNSGPDVTTTTVLQADEWYHAVITVTDQGGGAGQMFLNGVLEAEATGGSGGDYLGPMMFGNWSGGARFYHGLMDDIRIYDHVLSDAEIASAMAGKPWPFAFGPNPGDGSMLEATWSNLSWQPGQLAVSHDVYVGTSAEDVAAGAESTFIGNQVATNLVVGFPGFPLPDGLVPGTTYYWRVDEVNDADPNSPWKGDVWSFWVPPRKAYAAVPADAAQYVLSNVTLAWTGGFNSKLHTVYFGDNYDEVDNASGGVAQTATTFSPGTLEENKTYYWRVDEFDPPATHKGDVWTFTTVPQIQITDPSLVGWWTFDEGRGTTAVDWSGHGNHGSVRNTNEPLWVDGYQLTAMDMAGAAYVQVGGESWSTIENEATIALWVYGNPAQMPRNNSAFWAHDGSNRVFQAHIPWGNGQVYFDTGGSGYDRINKQATPAEYEGRWRHWTFVKNATTGEQLIYLDGVLWHSGTGLTKPMVNVRSFTIGSANSGGNIFPGVIDDVRLYNKALTVEEIGQVMLGNTKLAGSPSPVSDAIVDIRDIGSLSWSKGDTAASHDVYFGTARDAMELKGNQTATSLSLADLVEFGGGDYYWRIDEVESGGTVIAGTVWKFTVPDYLIVDNFESYNDINEGEEGSNRIYLTWIDGYGTTTNGSQAGNLDPPFMSAGHNSAQAMPVIYDNAGKTSEVTRTLTSKKDWTVQGVTKLVIWFSGAAANAADRMYVALGNAVVYHPDDAATQDTGWNEWVIDLAAFGVDLANVGSITLGFGTRDAPVATGGTGTVHFDDIRLIR